MENTDYIYRSLANDYKNSLEFLTEENRILQAEIVRLKKEIEEIKGGSLFHA